MEENILPLRVICPNLGLAEDPFTSVSYPSPGNHCFCCKTPEVPLLTHQEKFCLNNKHDTCPVYILDKTEVFPLQFQAKKQLSPRNIKRFPAVLLVIGILAGVLFWVFRPEQFKQVDQQGLMLQKTATAAAARATYTRLAASATPFPLTVTPTNIPTASPTATVTKTPALHALEVPIKVDDNYFLIHRVFSGENVITIAKIYNTTPEMLHYINYWLPVPIWAQMVIVIMPGVSETKLPLPLLEPRMVEGSDISIELLAKNLKANPALMMFYNDCVGGCNLTAGDWVLVPYMR